MVIHSLFRRVVDKIDVSGEGVLTGWYIHPQCIYVLLAYMRKQTVEVHTHVIFCWTINFMLWEFFWLDYNGYYFYMRARMQRAQITVL